MSDYNPMLLMDQYVSELELAAIEAADELTRLRSKYEALRARVAELESELDFIGGMGSALTESATLRKQAEAIEGYAEALKLWLRDLPGNPCASFIEGVRSSWEQAERYAQRLRAEASDIERVGV